MDIKQAYKILELTFDASADEIEKQYKKLSMKVHPDRGGSNDEFVALAKAKELALVYSNNKAVIGVANLFVNEELSLIHRKNEINEEVKSILNKKDRQARGKYQSMKDFTLVITAISGGFALLSNSFFSILFDNDHVKQILLMTGILFGAMYVCLNFVTNRLKDRIDELKELFDNKEEMFEVLIQVIGEKSNEILRREEIYLLIKEKYRIYDDRPTLYSLESNILSQRTSIRSFVKFIGYRDFGKILLLKGTSNKLLEEIETKENGQYEVKYKLKK
ncbi:MAG: DnaJ domain-containing protein [Bacteroidia bacterium]|nr:DnaJ domain-containing protein [Bacteroidia bacterium]